MKQSIKTTEPLAFNETKDFRRLQREWYGKLATAGFKDIESMDNDYLTDHGLRTLRAMERGSEELIVDFYRWVGRFYWDNKWETPFHKRVWLLFSEGKSERDIERILAKSSIESFHVSRNPINRSIKASTAAMMEWRKGLLNGEEMEDDELKQLLGELIDEGGW